MRKPEDYADMLPLDRPSVPGHPPMPRKNRAAQFGVFSPLQGYEESLDETARPVEDRPEQDAGQIEAVNAALNEVTQRVLEEPAVVLLCFFRDALKEGGAYRSVTGNVKKVDADARTLLLTDGTSVAFEDICALSVG